MNDLLERERENYIDKSNKNLKSSYHFKWTFFLLSVDFEVGENDCF